MLRRRGAAREAADTAKAGLDWLLPFAGVDYPDTQDAVVAWIDACDALNVPREPIEWIYHQVLDDASAPTMLPERAAYRMLVAMREPNVPADVITAARKSLDRLVPDNPTSAQLAVAAGMTTLRSGDHAGAIGRFTQAALLITPDQKWLRSVCDAGICLAHTRIGQPDAARAALTNARANSPSQPGPIGRALLKECEAAIETPSAGTDASPPGIRR